MLACTTSRSSIAKKYLEIAYFGTGKIGAQCFEQEFQCEMSDMTVEQVISIVARLKYPQPMSPNDLWMRNFDRRRRYIAGRLRRGQKGGRSPETPKERGQVHFRDGEK
jgi:membrane carboxypeptidase/penicillin-binding protein